MAGSDANFAVEAAGLFGGETGHAFSLCGTESGFFALLKRGRGEGRIGKVEVPPAERELLNELSYERDNSFLYKLHDHASAVKLLLKFPSRSMRRGPGSGDVRF